MKSHRVTYVFAFLVLSLTPCFAHHMAVVVDKDNSVGNVTSAHLAKMFRSEVKKWPDGKDVVLVLHKASSGEMVTLERLNKMSESEVKAFISSHKSSIMMVDSDADVVKQVESTPGAIGLVEVHSVSGGVNVVKVDGKLPMETGYLPH
jgi:ABC-type phosphate transport system substrate-binding protein